MYSIYFTYFIQPDMGSLFLLATATLFLVTCLGGGETHGLVSVSESSVRHGNQLTCEASSTGILLTVTLGMSTKVLVQVS